MPDNKSKINEKVLERKLVAAIKGRNGLCIKLLCDQLIGLPDRMCLLPGGLIIFVEVKTTGQKPRKSQLAIHDKFRALGFRVEVIDTIEKLNNLIENIHYGTNN